MILYISVYREFIKRAITFRRLSHGISQASRITINVIVVLARDTLACFGNFPESNRAFYEFMIYRNVQDHGDSEQKKIIMKTTNNMSENKRNIFLS